MGPTAHEQAGQEPRSPREQGPLLQASACVTSGSPRSGQIHSFTQSSQGSVSEPGPVLRRVALSGLPSFVLTV